MKIIFKIIFNDIEFEINQKFLDDNQLIKISEVSDPTNTNESAIFLHKKDGSSTFFNKKNFIKKYLIPIKRDEKLEEILNNTTKI